MDSKWKLNYQKGLWKIEKVSDIVDKSSLNLKKCVNTSDIVQKQDMVCKTCDGMQNAWDVKQKQEIVCKYLG